MDLENGAIASLKELNSTLTKENIDEEMELFQSLVNSMKSTLEDFETNKMQLESILKSMQENVESIESRMDGKSAIDQFKKEYFQLNSTKEELIKNIEKLKGDLSKQTQKLNEIEFEQNKLYVEKKEKSSNDSVKIPGLRHRLNLFKHIVNIEWEYNDNMQQNTTKNQKYNNQNFNPNINSNINSNINQNSQQIGGFIYLNEQKRVESFSFDSGKVSNFEIVNGIWDILAKN